MLRIKMQNDKLEVKGEADPIQLKCLIGTILLELQKMTNCSKEELMEDILKKAEDIEALMKTKEK